MEFGKLPYDGRWEIIESVVDSFGITTGKSLDYRVARVSDGYPYYVHLLMERIMWRVFEDSGLVRSMTREHYENGLRDAVNGMSAELKRPYEQAVNQPTNDYEEVLWSTSLVDRLHNYVGSMYASYQRIMEQLGEEPLSYERYRQRLKNLTKDAYGAILVAAGRRGLYEYREEMLRGYVRMQAEANDVWWEEETQDDNESHQTIPVPPNRVSGSRA